MINIRIPIFGNNNADNSGMGPSRYNRPYINVPLSGKTGGIIMIVLGLVCIGVAWLMMHDSQQTKDWPQTMATIQNVRTEQRLENNGDYRTVYHYSLVYTVNSQQFSAPQSSTQYVALGKQVKIAHNPQNPGDMRVREGGEWFVWLIGGVGIVLMIAGIFTTMKGSFTRRIPGVAAMTDVKQEVADVLSQPTAPNPAPSPSASPVATPTASSPSVSSPPSHPATPSSTPTPPTNYPPQPPAQSS